MPAEELSRQEVIYLSLTPCRSFCVLREPSTNIFKEFPIYDCRNATFNPNILVCVNTDILLIAEHGFEAVSIKFRVLCGLITSRIEFAANISNGFTIGIKLKRFLDNVSSIRVYNQFVIFKLISERDMTTNAPAFQSRLSHTTSYLLGKLSREKFSHALQDRLQDYAFRAVS